MQDSFKQRVREAIADRLDPEYVAVKLADLSEEGDAQQVAERIVHEAPESLRTTPRDFDAVREKAAELNRQGQLSESARKARQKLYAQGVVNNPNGTSDKVARKIGL